MALIVAKSGNLLHLLLVGARFVDLLPNSGSLALNDLICIFMVSNPHFGSGMTLKQKQHHNSIQTSV